MIFALVAFFIVTRIQIRREMMYPLLSPQWRAAGRPTITPYHAHSESPATMTTSLNNSRSGDRLLEINKMDVYNISIFPISPPHTS